MKLFYEHQLKKSAKSAERELLGVLNMNRDLFSTDVISLFQAHSERLSNLRRGTNYEALDVAIDDSRALIKAHAPKPISAGMRELVETLVVAFGIAMAFRAFFFQPFKIPTGSMQPTLYGIHSQCVVHPEVGPDVMDRMPLKAVKWLVTGSWYHDIVAESDGKVVVYADHARAPGYVLLSVVGKQYKVPHDAYERGEIRLPNAQPAGMADNPNDSRRTIATGYVKKGQRLWAGMITTGDQVFVNRFLWNFMPPQRDDVIVFTTSFPRLEWSREAVQAVSTPFSQVTQIPHLPLYLVDNPIPGLAAGQHYIKRLIGLPGETISIRHPYVYVNDQRVEGLPGIARVSSKKPMAAWETPYAGYFCTEDPEMPPSQNTLLRTPFQLLTLGDAYLPMGDNTRNSWDGRYWGGVPRRQMVGPGSFVYWPISRRWGLINGGMDEPNE